MYKPKPMIALTCLLDLLFVLIFAALLMVDPPISNSANLQSDDVLEELESQIVDLSRQAEELAEESENLEKELTEERLNNEKLSSDLELSIEEMNKAVSDSAVHLEALESERIKSEKIVLAEAKKNNEIELLRDKISELEIVGTTTVSYTHLTLPTICSV